MTEPAVIGDALYDDALTDRDDLDQGALFWEGTKTSWALAGSNAPGDVHLDAAREAEADDPWFTDDEWDLPPSCGVAWARPISAVVQEIFGDLGLPAPAETPVASTLTWDGLMAAADAMTEQERAASLAVADAAAADLAQSPVTLDDVAGLFGPDWTGGLGSVEFVRAQRDDGPEQWTIPIPIPIEEDE